MSDSPGSLVDKISTGVIKLWFAQQALIDAAEAGIGLDPAQTKRLRALNLSRHGLTDEFDAALEDIIRLVVREELDRRGG